MNNLCVFLLFSIVLLKLKSWPKRIPIKLILLNNLRTNYRADLDYKKPLRTWRDHGFQNRRSILIWIALDYNQTNIGQAFVCALSTERLQENQQSLLSQRKI